MKVFKFIVAITIIMFTALALWAMWIDPDFLTDISLPGQLAITLLVSIIGVWLSIFSYIFIKEELE